MPEDLRYTKNHEWVRVEGSEAVVGITDFAQGELTDVVFVDLPPTGKTVDAGASVLVLESVKTVSDVYAPCGGVVSATNEALKKHPELINQDPYGSGWIFRLRVEGSPALDQTIGADEYRRIIENRASGASAGA